MPWRIVSISQKSHISLRNNSLIIKQDEEISLPLEDIGVLLLESQLITTTAALLNACVQHKVALYICDEKHIPSGILLGYQQHSRQSKVIKSQLNLSEPFKKRLWQSVVKQKIQNQKDVYEKIMGKEEPKFQSLIRSVHSGDTLNREATAARLYFSTLLPKGSTRESDCVHNHALNYGYAIIRGAMARSVVSYGFISSIGIKHISELNNFALVDDLIEPYRPLVDAFVFQNISETTKSLDKDMRDALVAILTHKVAVEGQENTILRAIEITAKSLTTAINEKDPEKLLLPAIIL